MDRFSVDCFVMGGSVLAATSRSIKEDALFHVDQTICDFPESCEAYPEP